MDSQVVTQRDGIGRFLAGNRAGSLPRCNPLTELRHALHRSISPDEWTAATRRILALVMSDEPKVALEAYMLLRDTLFGKPRERMDLDLSHSQAPDYAALSTDQLHSIRAIVEQPRTVEATLAQP